MNRAVRYPVLGLLVVAGAVAGYWSLPRGQQTAVRPLQPVAVTPPEAAPSPSQNVPAAPPKVSVPPAKKDAEAKPSVAKSPAGAPSRPSAPLVPPIITTTSSMPEYRDAEMRLARFINALQMEKRDRAIGLLSSRVPERAREALRERRWLQPGSKRVDDFSRILFVKDLQIRPRGVIEGDTLKLYVIPRKIPFTMLSKEKKKTGAKELVGYLEIPMRRESGEWRVELLPERSS